MKKGFEAFFHVYKMRAADGRNPPPLQQMSADDAARVAAVMHDTCGRPITSYDDLSMRVGGSHAIVMH